MGENMHFSELDQYLFGQGTHYDIYKKLGAHPTTQGRKKGSLFCGMGAECAVGFRSWRF